MSGEGAGASADRAFERDKVCYEQNAQQFRALNQIMWQVPLLAVSITGGLWYAAINVVGAHGARAGIFGLAGLLNLVLVPVLVRVRYVMAQYLLQMEAFNPMAYVDAPGGSFLTRPQVVARSFQASLLLTAIASAMAAIRPSWLGF